jgi:hypothetical protein
MGSFMHLADDQILARIRFDADTQRGSVLDVVQLVTGCDQSNASHMLKSYLGKSPGVRISSATARSSSRPSAL